MNGDAISLSDAANGLVDVIPADAMVALQAIADEIADEPRYTDRSFFLDDENVAENDERRLALRGGFWNARDMGRVADGVTKADATAARKALRELGYTVTFDEADALLSQVVRGALGVECGEGADDEADVEVEAAEGDAADVTVDELIVEATDAAADAIATGALTEDEAARALAGVIAELRGRRLIANGIARLRELTGWRGPWRFCVDNDQHVGRVVRVSKSRGYVRLTNEVTYARIDGEASPRSRRASGSHERDHDERKTSDPRTRRRGDPRRAPPAHR